DLRQLHKARGLCRGPSRAAAGSRGMNRFCSASAGMPRGGGAGMFAAAVLALGLGVGGCGLLSADRPISNGDLSLLEDAMRQVNRSYVVPVKPERLVDGALKGMLSRLDPHSDYMTEREYRELLSTTSGQFGGVGIEISVEEGVPQVVS